MADELRHVLSFYSEDKAKVGALPGSSHDNAPCSTWIYTKHQKSSSTSGALLGQDSFKRVNSHCIAVSTSTGR
jgi:hypothetical protein